MLHITNGASVGASLGQSGLPGAVLAWQDVLHEGPVPTDLALDELRPVRARFLADAYNVRYEDTLAELAARDTVLASCANEDEVVLWFEHDLYDQLQLLQILDWFANSEPGTMQL